MLSSVNDIPSVVCMTHQPSHAFDDVWTLIFDRMLVIIIPSHIIESVYFPLPESLINWHASHYLLDANPILETWEM